MPQVQSYKAIPLTPAEARVALWENDSPHVKVMCRGYNDDDENFTELIWEDDWDLDFNDAVSYPEFQLWIFDTEYEGETQA